MADILSCGNVSRQAQIAGKRLVAKDFAVDVERFHESNTATSFWDAKTKLVAAELEMVRTRWVPQYDDAVRHFYLPGRSRCVQRG